MFYLMYIFLSENKRVTKIVSILLFSYATYLFGLYLSERIIIKVSRTSLRKALKFHLIFWWGNFVETHRFHGISGESRETVQKLIVSAKFLQEKTRSNYGILSNVFWSVNLWTCNIFYSWNTCFVNIHWRNL